MNIVYIFAILLVLGILFAFGVERLRMVGIGLLTVVALACAYVWLGHLHIP
ncbi:hypothetical protein KDA_25430 [Dictyobacter alpinus]|uniref:Uncharacterized protein n=1 Tax=Dictyobacter alpinus TaxID=2014873 RepID=A0A402B6V7_9CHLR|nr:hypothetical protein [Dictyobacter alpinus]GCE27059.1 hypothetical protein KDA_25430 [Dictyobacter alpinus]